MHLKKKYFVASFFYGIFYSTTAFSYTFSTTPAVRFTGSEVQVVYSLDECTGFAAADMETLIDGAIGYWNSVPYAKLELQRGDASSLTGDDSLSTNVATLNNKILVSCDNDNSYTFSAAGTWASSSVGGVGAIYSSGTNVAGKLVLNFFHAAPNGFLGLGAEKRVRLMAHEMGHAVGLGHSDQSGALMYYQLVVALENGMSEDDAAGYAALYPAGFSDMFTSCVSVKRASSSSGDSSGGGPALPFFAALIALVYVLLRRQTSRKASAL